MDLLFSMRHLFLHLRIIFLLSTFVVDNGPILGQCDPPPSETCDGASLFCSLDEMNGYTCTNPSMTRDANRPGCARCCPPGSNRTWWSFVSDGGNVSIKFSVGMCNCNNNCNYGIVFGIWGNCDLSDEIKCIAGCIGTNQSITYQMNLEACKVYYISADACCDCICDITMSTSGGNPPNLTLSNINNISNNIIGPICAGTTNYPLFVKSTGNCVEPTYIWTLNGNEVGDNKSNIKLDFPDPGEFQVCVTAYIGNPQSGAICSKIGPKCSTVKVRLPSSPTEVNYITCDNKPYIDPQGRSYLPCKSQYYISLPKKDPYDCDSILNLTAVSVDFRPAWLAKCNFNKVEISSNIKILNKCDVGESYSFSYKWYKKNDTLKNTISTDENIFVDKTNEDYCLETKVRVDLGNAFSICEKTFCDTINEANARETTENKSVYYCDSAVINGQTYFQNAQFTQQLKNVFGCDSVIITDLNITKSTTSSLNLQGCDSLVINNQVYYQSGNYTQNLVNSDNCDSLLYLNLIIGKTTTMILKMAACDSLEVGGRVYYQTGIYPEVYQSIDNCDSIVNLDLTIYATQRDSLSFSDCDKVVYKGKIYIQTGDYPEFYTSVNGCDSIVNVHINITSSNKGQLNETKCDSVTINGVYYDQSGNYTQKLTSANGCDSTLNIVLTIGTQSSYNYKLTSCDSAFIVDKWYYLSGNYTKTLLNTYQCDSTLNVALTINKSTSGDTIFRSCDSVTINGITYRQTGIYQQTLSNAMLCDSMLIIDFTRLSKSSTNLKYKSCDSIELNNIVYKQTGLYSQKLSNINQCDSLLSLDITINKGTIKDSTAQGCDSLIFNGQTYYQSGSYYQKLTNADLCDSSLNLSLTIYKSSTSTNVLRACDSVFKFGKWFYQSGIYPQYLKDVHQCDSTVNFHLTINNGGKQTIYKTACDSLEFSGIWFNKSGQYNFYLLNTNGCDSTITLDLTIKPGNQSTLDAGKDTSICEGDILKLNGVFSGNANFSWQSTNGNFDNSNNLVTNFYSKVIGDERIYLQASDDCKQWIDSLNVHIFPRQVVQVTGDTLVNPCKQIKFTASGGTNYIWTPSSYVECLDPPCSRVILKSSSITRFTISTDGPCAIPASLNLSLSQVQTDVYLPNAFSPNGDNINDVFLPVFNCEQVDYFNLQIFDRWGNLLFESQSKDKGWNGKSQEQIMIPGVYPYVLQYQVHGGERKVKAGDVTLVK